MNGLFLATFLSTENSVVKHTSTWGGLRSGTGKLRDVPQVGVPIRINARSNSTIPDVRKLRNLGVSDVIVVLSYAFER